jgi:hypothetical protein
MAKINANDNGNVVNLADFRARKAAKTQVGGWGNAVAAAA